MARLLLTLSQGHCDFGGYGDAVTTDVSRLVCDGIDTARTNIRAFGPQVKGIVAVVHKVVYRVAVIDAVVWFIRRHESSRVGPSYYLEISDDSSRK